VASRRIKRFIVSIVPPYRGGGLFGVLGRCPKCFKKLILEFLDFCRYLDLDWPDNKEETTQCHHTNRFGAAVNKMLQNDTKMQTQ